LHVEVLEARCLLSGSPALTPTDPTDAPDVLDPLLDPNLLTAPLFGNVSGTIGNRADGSGDVDWYRFDLSSPATVVLRQTAGSLPGVLSLYNTTEPFDPFTRQGDRYVPAGHRLLAQVVGTSAAGPSIVRNLAAGTYYVAVSGAGNQYFHPLVAGSGYPGEAGDYTLQITTADLGLPPSSGPVLLAMDPAAGSVLTASPLVIRLSLSGPLPPGALVELRGPGGPVSMDWTNFSPLASEMQLAPLQALAPGTYRAVLVNGGSQTVLGTFQVAGVEGASGSAATADDHPPVLGEVGGAHDLGAVQSGSLVQRFGFIGDDPYYDRNSTDPLRMNPAADVDLYHFEITADGTFGLLAEVFAGRIGSPLDPGVSLYRLNGGVLQLIASNDDTLNETLTADGLRRPLLNDALLFAGLTRGHYYLAVSSGGLNSAGNVPDPAHGFLPGAGGIFDPNQAHSGANGTTTGAYVLNLVVYPDATPPRVLAATPADGATVAASPAQVVITFSEAVNLPALANAAARATFPFPPRAAPAFVRGADGTAYYLRLQAYDHATNQATFLLPQHLPNGAFEIHLAGVTDLAGNPLAANGDFVLAFNVNDPSAGSGPVVVPVLTSNDDLATAQHLGTLDFSGLLVRRDFSTDPAAPTDSADYFVFQLPTADSVVFTLSPLPGAALPGSVAVLVTDQYGVPVPTSTNFANGAVIIVTNRLEPGTYFVQVGFWNSAEATGVSYQLGLARATLPENPPPLTTGPAPALGLRLTGRFEPLPAPLPVNTLTANSTPRPAGTEAFRFFAQLPPGSLTFLSAGPLGGPAGAEVLVLGNRLELGDLNAALVASLVRLTILTPPGPLFSIESDGEPSAALLGESLGQLEKSWGPFLDGLFSMSDWLQHLMNSAHSPVEEPTLPEEIIPPDEEEIGGEDGSVAVWAEFDADDLGEPETEWDEAAAFSLAADETAVSSLAWAVALAVGAAQSARTDRYEEMEEDEEE
jgi:methionine-rich copper-binding protein CopC